ncbi:MAG: type II secretion system protein [Sedimentisphaerales bacterium]|nr:type II secretion system protein [Sedimentisphaerales bacterium]
MMIKKSLANNKTGFTLIELLVVMTIIALLVSILLPALGRARKQARLVVCTVNLKEVGHGLLMYSMDNNDLFPSQKAIGGWKFRAAPGYRDPHDFYGYPERYGLAALLDGRSVDNRTGRVTGSRYRYIDGTSDIWVCPDCQLDWMRNMGNTYTYRTGSLIDKNKVTVLQRSVVRQYESSGTVSRVIIPAEEWLLRDNTGQLAYTPGFLVPPGESMGKYHFTPGKKDYPHLYGGNYSQAANTLYLDLHVERLLHIDQEQQTAVASE